MDNRGITIQESQMIKGIAILLMLFYHLFYPADKLNAVASGLLSDMSTVAATCHCCVTLFVFVTAYGLSIQEGDDAFQWKSYLKHAFSRYGRLVANLAYVFFVLLLAAQVFSLDYTSTTVWGEGLLNCIKGSLATITGSASLFGTRWFSNTWWYMKLAVLFLFLVPVLERVIRRLPAMLVMLVTLVGIPLAGLSTTQDVWSRYFIVVILGILFAQRNWIGKIWGYFSKRARLRIPFLAALVLLISVGIVARHFIQQAYLIDAAFTLLIVILAVFFRRIAHTYTGRILEYLGEHSMYMWWIHPFLLSHWFGSGIYSFQNVWLIFASSVSLTLLFAVGLTKAKQWALSLTPVRMTSPSVLSFVTAVLCLLITAGTSLMGYLSNDDGGIQNLLSGNMTGAPYITHQFINILLGAVISFLYTILPSIQWWYWYSLAILLVGMFLIHLCFFRSSRRGNLSPGIPLATVGLLDLVFMVYAIANIAFTIVPAILGSGMIAVCMIAQPMQSRKKQAAAAVLVSFVFLLILIHRQDTGFALLCYLLLAILYYMTRKPQKMIKLAGKFAAVCLCFAIITGITVGFNQAMTVQLNGEDFVAFNKARAGYMDHLKDSYAENPELYQQVGWDEDVAALVNSWCFIDENVTAENFRYLSEHSKTTAVNSAAEKFYAFISTESCFSMCLLCAAAALVAGYCLIRQFDKRFLFFFAANNGGTLVLLAYQLLAGRIIYRSAFVVLLPCFVINVLLLFEHFSFTGKAKSIGTLGSLFLALILSVITPFYAFSPARNDYKESAWTSSRQIEAYIMEHSDLCYITTTGVYNAIDPWAIYPDERPTNQIPWGGSAFHSDNYNKRLQVNGLTELTAESFLMDHVRFIFSGNATVPENVMPETIFFHLYRYLAHRTDIIGFVLEDQISGSAYVYRFLSSEDAALYDSYYTVTDSGGLELCTQTGE